MDRIIKKTQTLVVGQGQNAFDAAAAALKAGSQVMLLNSAAEYSVPDGAEAVDSVILDKIILYPEGRVAGVMGHQLSDGRKTIVNCDSVLLTPEAAAEYQQLCVRFGADTENGALKTVENGQIVNAEGKNIGGMYVISDAAATGGAGGGYAVMIDETIYARFRMHPMVNVDPPVEGEYYLTIVGIPGVPKHHIIIENKDGVLSGTHETENDLQPMQELRMEDGYLCWNLWAGTTSSELFTYHVKCYSGTYLGGTWRIDTENAQRTPVMMEPAHPRHPFGNPDEK